MRERVDHRTCVASPRSRCSAPREVEEFLLTHPKVADAHVVGVPDEKYGEELCE